MLPERWRPISIALLLAMGALASAATGGWLLDRFPVDVALASDGPTLAVTVEGRRQEVGLPLPAVAVRFPAPPPYQREYQIDGSDSTNNFTLDPAYFAREAQSPFYRFQAWLRDDQSFSRWQRLTIRDGTGRLTAQQPLPANDLSLPLPPAWTLSVQLHRLEIPRTIELLNGQGGSVQVVIDRNDRYLRIAAVDASGSEQVLAQQYYPERVAPAAANVASMLLRSLALALLLALAVAVVGGVAPPWRLTVGWRGATTIAGVAAVVVLAASCSSSFALFDRAPHVLDAVSYYFQARIFASGRLAASAPPVPGAFPTPFFVAFAGKWFSQYPPGTPLFLAAGFKGGLPWLVEPLLAAGAVALTFGAARRQFGQGVAALTALLLAGSPFLLLQAGTFLSHVPAMSCLALALYAASRYVARPEKRWIATGAAALGMAFLCREIAAVLYGIALFPFVLRRSPQRGRGLVADAGLAAAAFGAFLLIYLLYNALQTGDPFVLPRNLFNPTDRYGFGPGIGFYGQHTPGAGLVNTDELLTSLSFTLFGWPFYFSLALMITPFVLRRPAAWDGLHGAVVALFILAYVGYFYHGIAFGPRYYFEALPSMAILTARGFAALAYRSGAILAGWGRRAAGRRAQASVVALGGALLACNLIYFLPRQVALYRGFSGMPGGGGPQVGDFVRQDAGGRVATLQNALLTTDNWWYYSVYLAALNCPELNCPTVFAFAPDAASLQSLREAYPTRAWYSLQDQDDVLQAMHPTPVTPLARP